MVKPTDNTATNPQEVLPTVESAPTPDQQSQIISAFEKKTGKKFTPTTAAPTTFVGQPAADTRSAIQKVTDVSQTLAANEQDRLLQEERAKSVYFKRNGEWKYVPVNQMLTGTNTGSVTLSGGFREMTQSEFNADVSQTIGKIISAPFKAFGKVGGTGVQYAGYGVDKIPYTEWLENAVGTGTKGVSWLAQEAYDMGVKPLIRKTTTLLMTPIQVIENLLWFGPTQIIELMGSGGGVVESDASIIEQLQGLYSNTTLYQTVTNRELEGEGFFAGKAIEEKRNQLEERLRPKLYGQTATMGRTLAGLGVVTGVIEAGDDIHSLISGGIDATFQVLGDPVNKVVLPNFLKTVGDVPSAAAPAWQQKELVRQGFLLSPEVLAKADEVLSKIDEANRFSEEALNLVSPQPGVFYSGDRNAVANGIRDSFLDVGPGGPENMDNLVGNGLYISDSSPLASSYSLTEPGSEYIQIAQTDVATGSISGKNVQVPKVTGDAIVYEFRIPEKDFNIIDAEAPWPTDPSLPYNLNAALEDLGYSDNTLEQFRSALADIDIQASVSPAIEFLDDSILDLRRTIETPKQFLDSHLNIDFGGENSFVFKTIDSTIEQQIDFLSTAFEKGPGLGLGGTRKAITTRRNNALFADETEVLGRYKSVSETSVSTQIESSTKEIDNMLERVRAKLVFAASQEGGLDLEIFRARTETIDNLIGRYKSATEKLSQRKILEPGSSDPIALDRTMFQEGASELGSSYRETVEFLKSTQNDFNGLKSNNAVMQNMAELSRDSRYFYSTIYSVSASLGLPQKSVIQLGDIGPYKNLRYGIEPGYSSIGFQFDYKVDSLPWTHNRPKNSSLVNDWLSSKGVDAMRYNGGQRIGGYGNHEAMVVLKPSKLSVVAARTGEKLPTIEAAAKIAAGEELQVSATNIAKAQGYLTSTGLITGARNASDNSIMRYWMTTGYGKNWLKAIANEDDSYNIWLKVLKGRSPRLASKLAKANTPDMVEELLLKANNSVDPFERVSALPGWSGNIVSELGYRTKNLVSTKSRIAATLPRSNKLPLDDFAVGSKNLHDTMLRFGVPLEKRAETMREYLNIVSGDDFDIIKGQLFNFAKKAKETIVRTNLDPLIKDLEIPLAKPFEEMTRFERLTMRRRIEVAEEIKTFTRDIETIFEGANNKVRKYVIDDLGDMVPLAHLDGNGAGALYISQQNTSGFDLFPLDADEAKQFYDLTKSWAYYRVVAKTLPGMGRTSEALDTFKKFGFGVQTLWKKAVLFGAKYTVRVVSEETTRNSLSGVFAGHEFSYVAEVLTGRLGKDIYGKVYPSIDEADKIVLQLEELENYASRLERATSGGDVVEAAKLQKKLDKISSGAPKTYRSYLEGRLDEIDAIIESEGSNVRDVMIGPKPTGASDTVLGQSVPAYIRDNVQQVVNKNESQTLWLRGIGQEVIERSINESARSVAGAILDGSPVSIKNVIDDMLGKNGDTPLRKYYVKYFKQEGKLKPGYKWDTIQGAQNLVKDIHDDLMQITGGHESVLRAIVDGNVQIGGERFSLGRRTGEGNIPSEELLSVMRQGDGVVPAFADWDKAPARTTYSPPLSKKQLEKKNDLFGWFMQHTYGRASDKFARVPFWNRRKWNLIADMAPSLSKSEARLLSQTIDSYGLPQFIVDNVKTNLKRANGQGTLKQIDNIAGLQATEDTIGLLFDARKRTAFGANHRLLFPFFDAFREVGTQMIKTGINPISLHKIDKAQQAARNFRVGGPGDMNLIGPGDVDGDGKTEGFVYKDPTSNKLVWNLPLVGAAAKALTGVPFDFKIDVGSMSLMTSVIPGVGPVMQIGYTAVPGRTGETWDRWNKLVLPFGSKSTTNLADYFVPLAIRRFAQGVTLDTPFQNVTNLMGDPNSDQVFRNMGNRVLQHELASGRYEQSEEGIKQAMSAAQDKTAALWWLRGVASFFAPAAPIPQYYVETNGKLAPLGVILDGVRTVQNKVRDDGGTFNDQLDALVTQFGDTILPYLASLSTNSVPGSESTKEFYDFRRDNPELFKAYPQVAGYFAPNGQEFDQEIYNMQQRANEITVKPTADVAEQIQQLWGNYQYFTGVKAIEDRYGVTPMSVFGRSLLEQNLRETFPAWDRQVAYNEFDKKIENSVNQIIGLSVDKKFANFPATATLKEYLVARNEAIVKITKESKLTSTNSWKSNRGGILYREALKIVGDQFALDNPAFAPLWDNVLSKEYKTLTEQEKTLAKTGQLP